MLEKYIEKYIKARVKHDLIYNQKKSIASFEMMENYATNCILKGDNSKKTTLIEIQNRLNEAQKFLKFLTNK